MKTLSYTLCAVLAAGFAFTGDAQVKPKSKKVTELKFSGRIQGQYDGVKSDSSNDNKNHFYFRLVSNINRIFISYRSSGLNN